MSTQPVPVGNQRQASPVEAFNLQQQVAIMSQARNLGLMIRVQLPQLSNETVLWLVNELASIVNEIAPAPDGQNV